MKQSVNCKFFGRKSTTSWVLYPPLNLNGLSCHSLASYGDSYSEIQNLCHLLSEIPCVQNWSIGGCLCFQSLSLSSSICSSPRIQVHESFPTLPRDAREPRSFNVQRKNLTTEFPAAPKRAEDGLLQLSFFCFLFLSLKRTTDMMFGGKQVVVCGYGEVSQTFGLQDMLLSKGYGLATDVLVEQLKHCFSLDLERYP